MFGGIILKIVDLHCDTLSAIYEKNEGLFENTGHLDIERALQSNIGVQFFAMFTMPADSNVALREILKQLDKFYVEFEKNSEKLYIVKKYKDIESNLDKNKIACVLHLEGGEALGNDIEILRILYRLGLRSLGLTWNHRNMLADGVGEGERAGGLSEMGRKVIEAMNTMGMVLDLSHISERAFYDSLEFYNKPVIVTHANARALCNHRRNLNDRQLKALAENGGLIGINQVSDFVKQSDSSIDDLINHIIYIGELIGIEHIALGSDFDGADDIVMGGVQDYIKWEEILSLRGLSRQEIEMILAGNALRVLKEVIK